MHFYDSVDIGQSESSLLLNHTIARKEYIYYIHHVSAPEQRVE
jgi:hypothetical protein